MTEDEPSRTETLRLDKWLWHARMFKTRTLAAKVCTSGRVRVNSTPVTKAHYALKPGDVLTLPVGAHIRVLRVRAMGTRRGPAPEARLLYEDLSPSLRDDPVAPLCDDPISEEAREQVDAQGGSQRPSEPRPASSLADCSSGPPPARAPGSGRPTKAERRAVDRLRDRD